MKQTFFLTLAITLLLIVGGNAVAQAEMSIIVAQEGAPLKVLKYTAEFDLTDKKPLIEHNIKYQNVSAAKILSVRFGILEYNGYGELIDAFGGYTLEDSSKGEKDSATFLDPAEHSLFFKEYGEGYVWVDAIRYADGTIWKADHAQLLAELQKARPELSADDLVEKKSVAVD
jgi:hypothetical protein